MENNQMSLGMYQALMEAQKALKEHHGIDLPLSSPVLFQALFGEAQQGTQGDLEAGNRATDPFTEQTYPARQAEPGNFNDPGLDYWKPDQFNEGETLRSSPQNLSRGAF